MALERFDWLSHIPVGIVYAEKSSAIAFSTSKAIELLGLAGKDELDLLSKAVPHIWRRLSEAISEGRIAKEAEFSFTEMGPGGRTLRIWAQSGDGEGIVLTVEDITESEWTRSEERTMREEIDRAFSFSLLEPSVARKLRCTPEYQDEVVAPGLIRIKGVIPDGGYRHVINILKLAADLDALEAFEFPGLSRNVIARVAIYHDLAKTQPVLKE